MKTILLVMAIAALAAFPAPAWAQENETPNGRAAAGALPGENKALDKRVTLRFRGATLGEMLKYLSRETGAMFSVSEDLAERRVTVFLNNVKLGEVLELLTKSKGLDFRRTGDGDNFLVSQDNASFTGFPPLTRKDIEDPLLNKLVSIKVKSAILADFLNALSEQAKMNFVITGDAADLLITAEMNKTTVADVLLFLKGKGLSYSRIGDSNTFVIRPLGTASDNFAKAEKAFKDAKYEEAIGLYEELADKFPDSEMADYALLKAAINYDWLAAKYNDASQLKEEERLLNRLIKDYPKSPRLGDAYLYLGQLYSGYGGAKTPVDCEKAIKFYEQAIKNTYRDWVKAQASGRIAQCYELAGKKEKAAAMYREIIEKYPDTAAAKELGGRAAERDPLLVTGAVLEEKGKYKLAIDIYEADWEGSTEESRRKAKLRVAICQAALKETAAAIKTFEAYEAKYRPAPGDAVYLLMGQALEKAGSRTEARKYLGKAGK